MASPQKPVKESHQVRALARKALSYQKRQWFANLCCIGCCPCFMTAFSAGMGTALNTLIQKSQAVSELLYCSDAEASDQFNVPITNITDPRLTQYPGGIFPGSTAERITLVNFLSVNYASKPCVYWFGKDYPTNMCTKSQ